MKKKFFYSFSKMSVNAAVSKKKKYQYGIDVDPVSASGVNGRSGFICYVCDPCHTYKNPAKNAVQNHRE